MDIRHDLEVEMESLNHISAEDWAEAQDEAMWASEEEDDGFGPEMFDDDDSEIDYDDVSYDGESVDFGLFEDF